jgi:S-layer homology domain
LLYTFSMNYRHLALVTTALAIPTLVLAQVELDFSDSSNRYSDAPFSTEEAAGISLLTHMNVLQGNPDGTFAPKRPLNRAEFTKIAYGVFGAESKAQAKRCFPDVQKVDWFSSYVCWAKEMGAVKGYPDGYFHPERTVNYAEALKIMMSLAKKNLGPARPGDQWYTPYIRSAVAMNAGLPKKPAPGTVLTRGEAARVAAAIYAEAQGQLNLYRSAENGETISSSSSSVSSSATSSSVMSGSGSSMSSSSSSSSSVASVAGPELPARSQFLLLGKRSRSIGAMKLFAEKEALLVRSVEVKLREKTISIDRLYMVAEDGTQMGEITLDHVFDQNDRTYRATFSSNLYRIPKSKEVQFAIEAKLRAGNGGGVSGQLVEIERIILMADGEDSSSQYNGNSTFLFPRHQTSYGHLTGVSNSLPATDGLTLGTDQLLGSFVFTGSGTESAPLRVSELTFQVSADPLVDALNWKLGTADSPSRISCSAATTTISCFGIPPEFGTLNNGTRTLRLYADVNLRQGSGKPFIQVSLNQPGTFDEVGAIRWNDGANTFSWTELTSPVAKGTKFE